MLNIYRHVATPGVGILSPGGTRLQVDKLRMNRLQKIVQKNNGFFRISSPSRFDKFDPSIASVSHGSARKSLCIETPEPLWITERKAKKLREV